MALVLSLLLPSLPFSGSNPSRSDLTNGDSDSVGTGEEVGIRVLEQTREHIPFGQPHPLYSSTPPTSGWHYDTPAAWGIYDSPLLDETVIHNLEHGGIVISQNLTDGAQVAQLREFVEGQPGFPGCFIMRSYTQAPDLVPEGTVALTSWEWLQGFDGVDAAGMQAFIDAHKNLGPEFLNSRCGG